MNYKEKILDGIKESNLNEMSSLYSLLTDICSDYSRMTDGYSIATGDNKFEQIPDEIREMINERQRFYEYRNIVKDCIKTEIVTIMENAVRQN